MEEAQRKNTLHYIINEQEKYLGAEQCFLVRGKCASTQTFQELFVTQWIECLVNLSFFHVHNILLTIL